MKRRCWTTCALALLLAPSAFPGTVPAGTGTPPAVQVVPVSEGRRLLNTGTSFTDRGDFPAAESVFRQVLNGDGFSVAEQESALLGLARNYRKAGAPTKAAAIYEKFIKEFPNDDRLPDAILDLGRTYRSMGVNKLALNRFYSVINTTLKLPQKGFEHYQSLARTAEYEIAETYYENGDFELAGKYFSRLQLLDLAANDRARASFMAAHAQILADDLEGGSKSLHSLPRVLAGRRERARGPLPAGDRRFGSSSGPRRPCHRHGAPAPGEAPRRLRSPDLELLAEAHGQPACQRLLPERRHDERPGDLQEHDQPRNGARMAAADAVPGRPLRRATVRL